MSNEKASKSPEPSDSREPKDDLTDEELAKVAGGVGVAAVLTSPGDPDNSAVPPGPPNLVESNVISPRDPASGLPTGKRMHKPVL